jgi:arylsulfatase A-like enzyme
VAEGPEEVAAIRARYAALVAMCDEYLGRLLDRMDAEAMWDDTLLIATTDHGFLLGEHDWWAKVRMPHYQELSHIPLIVCHPDDAGQAGTRRSAVTSAIDIMPTVMDALGGEVPPEVRGRSLLPLLAQDGEGHAVALSGVFGGPMLITDGDYAFHYCPRHLDSTDLYEYRLLPMHMREPFSLKELRKMELAPPFDFTKEVEVLKIKARDDSKRVPNHDGIGFADTETRLYDLRSDPEEAHPFRDAAIEARLLNAARTVMQAHDAPDEMFRRFALDHAEARLEA